MSVDVDCFSCPSCGSPAISLPADLDPIGTVVCDRCGRPHGPLASFRRACAALIAQDDAVLIAQEGEAVSLHPGVVADRKPRLATLDF